MGQTLTVSTEDYLKHIYELTEGGGSASTSALASELGVRPASVTGMLQRLASARTPLVEYRKHQGVTLTKEGRKRALEVIRHHRLLESWLVQTLGYTWDEVHEEAEHLEHAISEDFERRIASALGNPSRDPHGELIPTASLHMPSDDTLPLSALRTGQSGVVRYVKVDDTAVLRQLREAGLVPGARVKVSHYSSYDQNHTLRVGPQEHVVGLAITSRIRVKKES